MFPTKIFGCKVNKYYTDQRCAYIERGQKHNVFERNKTLYNLTNAVFVASCIVTQRAKKKWQKHVLKELKIGKTVLLTGCGVFDRGIQLSPKDFFNHFPLFLPYQESICLLPETPPQEILETKSKKYTRKFIVIQNGCDNFCQFCLSIYARGKHRSRDSKDIIQEIQEYEAQGGKEIILTGVNIGARGASATTKPSESQLSTLLTEILTHTTIPRIRISSLDPEYVSEELLSCCENTRILPYFHLSIQSFSDKILDRMGRHYDAQTVIRAINGLRDLQRPDKEYINIGADIICGFPGETTEDFAITKQHIAQYDITQLHAFPFSAHTQGRTIPASKLPDQIPYHLRKQRVSILRDIAKNNRKKLREKTCGQKMEVLIESIHDGIASGRTPNYLSVQFSVSTTSNIADIETVVIKKEMK